MIRRGIVPLFLTALSATAVAFVLLPRLGGSPGAHAQGNEPPAPDKSQGVCHECHGAGGAAREDSITAPSGSPGPVLYEEQFTDGKLALNWQLFPSFSPDLMKPVRRSDAPDGDGWAGLLSDESFGGFASMSYAGDEGLSDYTIEAWVYTEVTTDRQAPIHGVAVRVDPGGNRFYRLAAQFGAQPRITLAYVGQDINNFPDYLKTWGGDEIPGGAPARSGWHRIALRVEGDRFCAYWDDQALPGGPFVDGRISNGYFGIYNNFVGGRQIARTLVDGLIVR